MELSAGAYLAGVAELAAIVAALGFGAHRLRAALLPEWSGAPARLAEIVLAIAGLVWTSQGLGVLGILEEWPLVLACIGVGLGAAALAPRLARAPGPALDSPRPGSLQLTVALGVVALLVAQWAIPSLESVSRGMYGFDTQWYHMPFAARFAQTGEIWPFHHTSPVYLSWFYPANSELVHTTGILAFGRDLVAPLLNMGWLALGLLAAWVLGRPWGVAGWSVLGAGVVLAGGVFADQPGDARNDIVALALILASGALLANGRLGRPGPALALAAIAAGLALGTRLTALAPVAALTVGVIVLAPRGERRRAALAWLVPLLAAGGLWYLRNLAGSGNPLPWVDQLGPLSLPAPDQELGGREPFSVAHYATDFDVWGEWFAPALETALGALWPGVLVLAAVGALAVLRRGSPRAAGLLGAVAIVGAVAYLFTPVTAAAENGDPVGFQSNLRYLTAPLALALALVPVGLAGARRSWRIAGLAALAAVFVAAALDPDRWDDGYLFPAALAGVLAVVVALLVAMVQRGGGGLRGPAIAAGRERPLAAAALLVIALAVVAAGYARQRESLDERYASVREVLPNPGLDTVFEWARGKSDSRIGTITTRQYPLYGTDLSNHVQFVGIEEPGGGFVRAETCEEWRAAVNGGDYDYLITALDRAEPGVRRPIEERWTSPDPAVREVASDGPATVFAVEDELDSSRCR